MDAFSFLIVISIALLVYYLYLRKLFAKDSQIKLPTKAEEPGSAEEEKMMVQMIEPGIDASYQETIMGPSVENIYEADDYYEGSPVDEPRE